MINFKKNNCRLALVALVLLAMMPARAERVTPEKARKAAQTFLNNNGAKTAQLTDLSKAAGFANLYIFASEQGFVVMAADDCVQPILGYSLTQSPIQPTAAFNADDMPDNVRGWLQGYSDEIQAAINSKAKATAETAMQWKDLIDGNSKAGRATTVVAPLIQTKWNQNKYYNNLCPAASGGPNGRAYTGCVATAMAQIMKFWNYPSYGIGSHSYIWNNQTLSANFGETTYDWNNMGLYYEYYYSNPTGNATLLDAEHHTSEKVAAVATLLYHCGVSVDMEYGGKGSSASTSNVATALKTYFNYNPNLEYIAKTYTDTHGSDNPSEWGPTNTYYSDEQWIAMLKAELDVLRPMVYRGADPGSRGGHSFVCDGYDDRDYFHFNWGWAGSLDGYFTITNLNTGANTQSGAGNGNYTRDQAAIFGIRPSNNNSAPTNLTYTMQGLQGLTLNWTAASDAARYNVYCNGNLVENTTSTTYSETARFGNNEYYVRSVDANGELSLPTNTVSIYVGYQQPIVNDLSATLSGNDVSLSWSAPDWCYPETPSVTLNYGQDSPYYSWGAEYYGHRHEAADLEQYAGKAVYKVSTYISYPGTYSLYIYTNAIKVGGYDFFYYTNSNNLAASVTDMSVTISNAWYDFELSSPIILDGSKDLWVVIKQENTGQTHPSPSFNLSGYNAKAFFYGWVDGDGDLYMYNYDDGDRNCAWLINTYLTDGIYTYNLYQDGTPIAQNISQTSYDANLNDDAANLFTVKTNYYGGKTAASNAIGFAKGTASVANLEMAANDQMTVTDGSQLTVSGAMSNGNAENLIIENGAQLIHNTEGVKATVKKTIEPYTTDEAGWYFIASPAAESIILDEGNGLNGTYDLYQYDEPAHYWRNHKGESETSGFSLAHKQGYLYANSAPTTLQFAGTLTPSKNSLTISELSHDADVLNGFNLVGNPFACNATVAQDCYVINDDVIDLASTDKVFAPCEGAFVKTTENNNFSVTFTKAGAAKGNNANGKSLDLVVAQGKSTLNRARLRLGEGTNMERFSFGDKAQTSLAFHHDGQDCAVAYANGMNELPLHFKAAENGTYSIGIEHNSLDVNYLHLIDNMTGEDVDLLATNNGDAKHCVSTYTFEAKTTDYASRFRLVFAADDASAGAASDATFAYISNGNIVITADAVGDVVGDAGTASLQVVDMTGRVIVSVGGHTRCVPTTGIPSGVYVLRLIDGENVKTQKMVID